MAKGSIEMDIEGAVMKAAELDAEAKALKETVPPRDWQKMYEELVASREVGVAEATALAAGWKEEAAREKREKALAVEQLTFARGVATGHAATIAVLAKVIEKLMLDVKYWEDRVDG